MQLQTWRAASFGRGADISFGSIAESQPPVELIRFRAKRHREIYCSPIMTTTAIASTWRAKIRSAIEWYQTELAGHR